MTVGEVVAYLKLDLTQFRTGLNQATSLLDQYRGSAMATAGILAGFGTAIAAGLAVAVRESVAFEAQMRNVNSILEESEEQFQQTGQAVLSMAGRVGQAPAVLARGLYDVASSGFKGADALKILEISAQAATAGLTDAATAARANMAVLNAYGMSASEVNRVSDVLFQTVKVGVITYDQLAQQLGDVVSTAALAKVPIEEVGAAISALTLAGVQPAEAVTSLNQALLSFIGPTADAQRAAKDLGIDLSATGLASKGFSASMEDIRQKAGGNVEALNRLFPNIRAFRGAAVLAGEGAENFSAALGDMNAATGATSRAFAEQSKSFTVQWAKTTATLRAAAVGIGNDFVPALKSAAAVLRALVAVGEWLPGWLRTIAAVSVLAAGGLASMTAAFILYNLHLKESIVLMGGFLGAFKLMLGTTAEGAIVLNSVTAAAMRLKYALTSLAGAQALGSGIVGSLRGGALGIVAIAAGINLLYKQFAAASQMGKDFAERLREIEKRAVKAKVEVEQIAVPGLWSRLMEWAGYRTADMDKFLSKLNQYNARVADAETAREGELAVAQAQARAETDLRDATESRIDAIEREREASIKAGVDPAVAGALAERKRAEAEGASRSEIMRTEQMLLEMQGKRHAAAILNIELEAQERATALTAQGVDENEAARLSAQYRLQLIAKLQRDEEADRRRIIAEALERQQQIFRSSAQTIAGDWSQAVEEMRQAGKLQTGEYIAELGKVIAWVQQVNQAAQRVGVAQPLLREELQLAQQIRDTRARMVDELTAKEAALAAARKSWAAEELDWARKIAGYQVDAMNTLAQYQKDVLTIGGEATPEALAGVDTATLDKLRAMMAEPGVDAQTLRDLAQEGYRLAAQLGQEGALAQDKALEQLAFFREQLVGATSSIIAQEKAAFEERKAQSQAQITQLEREQEGVRAQLRRTSGSILTEINRIFDRLDARVKGLGNITLRPAVAAAAGGRTMNVYINGARIQGDRDLNRILQQLEDRIAAGLERDHRFPTE